MTVLSMIDEKADNDLGVTGGEVLRVRQKRKVTSRTQRIACAGGRISMRPERWEGRQTEASWRHH